MLGGSASSLPEGSELLVLGRWLKDCSGVGGCVAGLLPAATRRLGRKCPECLVHTET